MQEFSVSVAPPDPATTAVSVTVTVTGDVDLATAERLRETVLARIEPGREIRLDCSGVQFLDSAGLRVLLEADRTARAADATLVLAAPSDPMARTMTLAGVADVFTVRPAVA